MGFFRVEVSYTIDYRLEHLPNMNGYGSHVSYRTHPGSFRQERG